MKKAGALLLCVFMCIASACGAGNSGSAQEAAEEAATQAVSEEHAEAFQTQAPEPAEPEVSITIPEEIADDITDESIKKAVEDENVTMAVRNEDGSVTYTMTKSRHDEMMKNLAQSIDENLQSMAGSEQYPNITSITANDTYTSFTVTTKSKDSLDAGESVIAEGLERLGEIYSYYNGQEPGDISVEFVNDSSSEVIMEESSEAASESPESSASEDSASAEE